MKEGQTERTIEREEGWKEGIIKKKRADLAISNVFPHALIVGVLCAFI